MSGKGLGFYPGSHDERDWPLKPRIDRMAAPQVKGSRFWYGHGALDQGSEGACVGFSWCQMLNSSPRPKSYDNEFAFGVYNRAKDLDEWEGSDYDGTSVRAGGLAAKEKNLITGFAYAATVEELVVWLLNKGPAVLGVNWRSGADSPKKENDYYIYPMSGNIRGGHAIEVDGVRWMHKKGDYFRLRNSWGSDWGYGGRCKVSRDDMERWLAERWVAMAMAVDA